MYAVFQTGGKQYRVQQGDRLRVEKLPVAVGEQVVFHEVLLVCGEALSIGQPFVEGARVEATVRAQDRGKKIIVFKFRRRKSYRKKQGHRQAYTLLEINGVFPA